MKLDLIRWLAVSLCKLTHLTDLICHAILDVDALAVVNSGAYHFIGGSAMAGRALTNILQGAGRLVAPIMELVTPNIRKALVDFVLDLEVKAKETPNLYDDVAIDMIKAILNITEK